jgi:hypothetical protein
LKVWVYAGISPALYSSTRTSFRAPLHGSMTVIASGSLRPGTDRNVLPRAFCTISAVGREPTSTAAIGRNAGLRWKTVPHVHDRVDLLGIAFRPPVVEPRLALPRCGEVQVRWVALRVQLLEEQDPASLQSFCGMTLCEIHGRSGHSVEMSWTTAIQK